MMPNTNDASTDTPLVSQSTESGVTQEHDAVCGDCGATFSAKPHQKFCSSPCRQRAYRKGFSHAKQLQKKKRVRMARRAYHDHEKYRSCSIGFDGRFGGSVNDAIPSVGQLDLKNFKKESL